MLLLDLRQSMTGSGSAVGAVAACWLEGALSQTLSPVLLTWQLPLVFDGAVFLSDEQPSLICAALSRL